MNIQLTKDNFPRWRCLDPEAYGPDCESPTEDTHCVGPTECNQFPMFGGESCKHAMWLGTI